MLARLGLGLLLGLLLGGAAVAAPKGRLEGVVNINTASPDELQLLPGVGPAKVRDIVAYRTKHRFRTTEELIRIKGIGRKMFRRLRLHLAVTGPTTAYQVIRAEPSQPLPEPPPLLRRPIPFLPLRPPPGSLRRPAPRPPNLARVTPPSPCLRGP